MMFQGDLRMAGTKDITRIDSPGFLDLDMPDQLFHALIAAFSRYEADHVKRIDDVFLLVLGLAHLREWIAPGFKGRRAPRNPAERFSETLFQHKFYQILLHLANHAKHQFRDDNLVIRSVHYDKVNDWPNFDRVNSVDDGPVRAYFVGDHDLCDLFDEVLAFYRDYWFNLDVNDQVGSLEERMRNVLLDDGKYHR
jgi:hypothetical protein